MVLNEKNSWNLKRPIKTIKGSCFIVINLSEIIIIIGCVLIGVNIIFRFSIFCVVKHKIFSLKVSLPISFNSNYISYPITLVRSQIAFWNNFRTPHLLYKHGGTTACRKILLCTNSNIINISRHDQYQFLRSRVNKTAQKQDNVWC